MLRPNYEIIEEAGLLSVQWLPPALPDIFRPLGASLLVFGLLLFLLRRPAAAALARTFPPARWTWLAAALLGPALSLLGALAVYFTEPRGPLVRWDITPQGLSVKSLNGETAIPWDSVASIVLEDRGGPIEKSSLVVSDAQGRRAWLVLKWLLIPHRRLVIEALAERLPEKMRPVSENKAFMEKISES